MARKSKAELEFRAKYPFANVRQSGRYSGLIRGNLYEVYAGDYLCAEGTTVAKAFREALRYDREGYITPDPNEKPTEMEETR